MGTANSEPVAKSLRTFIRAFGLLVALGVLAACATTTTKPVRIQGLSYTATGQTAYLWSHGINLGSGLTDYAYTTQMDNVMIPAKYMSQEILLEIPAATHVIEVIYAEDRLCGIYCSPAEKVRKTLTFTAAPGRVYATFASDMCSSNWVWIEDFGPYVAAAEVTRPLRKNDTPSKTSVVAGDAPDKHACESE